MAVSCQSLSGIGVTLVSDNLLNESLARPIPVINSTGAMGAFTAHRTLPVLRILVEITAGRLMVDSAI